MVELSRAVLCEALMDPICLVVLPSEFPVKGVATAGGAPPLDCSAVRSFLKLRFPNFPQSRERWKSKSFGSVNPSATGALVLSASACLCPDAF